MIEEKSPALSTSEKFKALEGFLKTKLEKWDGDRKNQEAIFLRAYEDFMRISTGLPAKGTGLPRAGNNEIFVGLTRSKIRSARAKMKDIMFGNGREMPFDIQPVDARFNDYVNAFKAILKQQLDDGDFVTCLKTAISQNTLYGTSYMAGPFVRKREIRIPGMDETGKLAERVFSYSEPFFLAPLTMDVYPDSSASDELSGVGLFWEEMHSPEDVASWKKDQRYFNIDEALKNKDINYKGRGSDRAKQARASVQLSSDGRVPVARFFGVVDRDMIPADYLDVFPELKDDRSINIIAYMAGDIVIRVDISPYWSFTRKRPIYRCVHEESDGEFFGVGIAENNAPQQKLFNQAFRLFIKSKALALNPPYGIDRSKFKNSENFKFEPGKALDFKDGLSADEQRAAIQRFDFVDVSEGWQSLIERASQFSDDDTAVPKLSQGTEASHQSRTATGMSMLLGAAHIPMKEVITNIDTMLIEPVINALIEWNFKYLSVETVQELHGPDIASKWAEIKQVGSTSFMRWNASGTNTFMANEVLLSKYQGLLSIIASAPALVQYTNLHALLLEIWRAMGTGKDGIILTQEQVKALIESQMGAAAAGVPSNMSAGGQPNGSPPEMPQGTPSDFKPDLATDVLASGASADKRIVGAAQQA